MPPITTDSLNANVQKPTGLQIDYVLNRNNTIAKVSTLPLDILAAYAAYKYVTPYVWDKVIAGKSKPMQAVIVISMLAGYLLAGVASYFGTNKFADKYFPKKYVE